MPRRKAPQPAVGGPVTRSRRRKLDQQRPVDRISALSDDLLGEIILLLPVKDGGRTPALASRWRHLWRSAPLNLDCCDLGRSATGSYSRSDVAPTASRILSAHPGPVRRFCACTCDKNNADDAWLRSTKMDGLEELEFAGFPQPSIFRFSGTLRVAFIADCNLPDGAVQGLQFPRLKQLGLERVTLSERSLHGLIAGCPALEFLLLRNCSGFRCLRINSPSLTRLCVHIETRMYTTFNFDAITIENAPRLERLIYRYYIFGEDVSLYYAPKLESLDFLANLKKIGTELVSVQGFQESWS